MGAGVGFEVSLDERRVLPSEPRSDLGGNPRLLIEELAETSSLLAWGEELNMTNGHRVHDLVTQKLLRICARGPPLVHRVHEGVSMPLLGESVFEEFGRLLNESVDEVLLPDSSDFDVEHRWCELDNRSVNVAPLVHELQHRVDDIRVVLQHDFPGLAFLRYRDQVSLTASYGCLVAQMTYLEVRATCFVEEVGLRTDDGLVSMPAAVFANDGHVGVFLGVEEAAAVGQTAAQICDGSCYLPGDTLHASEGKGGRWLHDALAWSTRGEEWEGKGRGRGEEKVN